MHLSDFMRLELSHESNTVSIEMQSYQLLCQVNGKRSKKLKLSRVKR